MKKQRKTQRKTLVLSLKKLFQFPYGTMPIRRKKAAMRLRKKKKGNNVNGSDWTQLSDDLLEMIAERLAVAGCVSFSKVCRVWRSIVAATPYKKSYGFPWLLNHLIKGEVYLWIPGCEDWLTCHLVDYLEKFVDAVFFNGYFYLLSDDFTIRAIDASGAYDTVKEGRFSCWNKNDIIHS